MVLAKDIISDVLPALRTTDTGSKALNWMEIFRISHLPIVNDKEFVGIVSDNDIYDTNLIDEPIGNIHLSLHKPYVLKNQHIYEVLETVARLKLSVIPVLDDQKHYYGIITLPDLVHNLSSVLGVEGAGAIIVLDVHFKDYSMTEIAQIIESNDAKIIASYVNSSADSMRLEITLKVNKSEIDAILQTFERYEYIVSFTFSSESELSHMYENRYESFINYLSI